MEKQGTQKRQVTRHSSSSHCVLQEQLYKGKSEGMIDGALEVVFLRTQTAKGTRDGRVLKI